MLRIAYIANNEVIEKPKKLTKKQQIEKIALEGLEVLMYNDQLKAEKKYAVQLKELEKKEKYLMELESGLQ